MTKAELEKKIYQEKEEQTMTKAELEKKKEEQTMTKAELEKKKEEQTMKRIFKFSGYDSWDRPVYEGEDGTLLVDVDPISTKPINLCTKYQNKFNGEPNTPVQRTKYKDDEISVDRRVTWW